MGISHDQDKLLRSEFLVALKSGAEACPFWDQQWNVVYKLFPLLSGGGLGKTFTMELNSEDDQVEITTRDASLFETLEKLITLCEAGALPTEIVGLADTGDYLIVKQPYAKPYREFESDRELAVEQICGVVCRAPVRRSLWVIWMNELAFLVSDLHKGNIMRDAYDDAPSIIDALFCPVPHSAAQKNRWLYESIQDAKVWRLTGKQAERKAFDDVDTSEL